MSVVSKQPDGVVRHAVPGEPVIDPADWQGDTLSKSSDWLFLFDDNDIAGLLAMCARIRATIRNNPDRLLRMEKEDFDLGAVEPKIRAVRETLKDGLGLALIRGLPIQELSPLDSVVIYWAIGRHLGTATPNNPHGDMIGHVTDLGKDYGDSNTRGYQTRAEMQYHRDQCDVVGLLCLRTSKSGGLSKIASSVAVYNALLERRPDLVSVLMSTLCWSKNGEVDPGAKGYYESPVFNFKDGYLCTAYGSKHIERGHALPEAPDMTDLQKEAITTFAQIADELRFTMELAPGDMQFLNNDVALHTRTGYEDWPEPERKRLLWRLWLCAPDMRPRTPYTLAWSKGVQLNGTKARIVI